jgi:prophage antirepressor-like protein
MEELKVVKETEILGKKIVMYGSIENPWFLAKDVAEWIDYSKSNGKYQVSAMLRKIDDDEKGIKTFTTLGGNQNAWFLTEDGLYESCMKSTKPIAKQMKKEIKSYLKQIRLTGGYIPIQEEDSPELIMAKGLKVAEETIKNKDAIISQKDKQIAELKPDAEMARKLMNAKGWLSLKQVADNIEIGRTTLCSLLRQKKVLSKQTGYNEPMGKYIKSGYFKTIMNKDEKHHITPVVIVSPKGLKFVYRLIKRNELLDEFDVNKLQEVQANA